MKPCTIQFQEAWSYIRPKQIQRLMQRDGIDENEALLKISNQMDIEEKLWRPLSLTIQVR